LCIEVIEHTSPNFIELYVIHRSLVDGALLYVETGFVNICDQDHIELDDYVYINDVSYANTLTETYRKVSGATFNGSQTIIYLYDISTSTSSFAVVGNTGPDEYPPNAKVAV